MLNINADTKLYAVLGYPVNHSLSPQMQNAWFEQNKLNSVYFAFETAPKKLKETLDTLKKLKFGGCNITVPLKIDAVKFADKLDTASRKIGSLNTIAIRDGKLYGYNTDYSGFLADLKSKKIQVKGKTFFVYGAGGAAKAVVYALKNADAKTIFIANRTYAHAVNLAKKFRCTPARTEVVERSLALADVIINASACGLNKNDKLPFTVLSLPKKVTVYDLVYNKALPPFKAFAKKFKLTYFSGEGMLIWQGAKAFEIWTGKKPDIKKAEKIIRGIDA